MPEEGKIKVDPKDPGNLVAALCELRGRGQISEDEMNCGFVVAAFQAAKAGKYAFAKATLGRCPPEFYREAMPARMRRDLVFGKVALGVALLLAGKGAVDLGPRVNYFGRQATS